MAAGVLVLAGLTGCPAAECKPGEQTGSKTWAGPVKDGKRKLCRKVETCKDGRWVEYINPESCHEVDA